MGWRSRAVPLLASDLIRIDAFSRSLNGARARAVMASSVMRHVQHRRSGSTGTLVMIVQHTHYVLIFTQSGHDPDLTKERERREQAEADALRAEVRSTTLEQLLVQLRPDHVDSSSANKNLATK